MIQLSFPILIPLSNQLGISGVVMMHFLPNLAPSLILCLAGNLASSSLQDGATEWLYDLPCATPRPPPIPKLFFPNPIGCLIKKVRAVSLPNVVWYTHNNCSHHCTFCHTWLHLGFSAKLGIFQFPDCKMEP